MTTSRTVFVTGGRGKTGRRVVDRLRQRPDVVVRAGSSVAAPGFHAFSWGEPDTWPEAVSGVDVVYAMRPDVPDAPALVAGLVEANPQAHVVLLSEQGAGDLDDGHWTRRVEAAVTARAQSWTLLRPSWFQQVLTDPRFYRDSIRDDRTLSLPSRGGAIAWVDADDIADVAVAALLSPDAHHGRAYTLTGPEDVTVADVAADLSRHLGHVVKAEDPPADAIADDPWMTEVMVDLSDRVGKGGFAGPTADVERVTGRPPRSIGGFIAANVQQWR